jgi:hypothetical protein
MKRGTVIWILVLLAVIFFIASPFTHGFYISATANHPYITGFLKFAVLSTMGEYLSVRISSKKWMKIPGIVYKTLIWGVIGLLVTLMFTLFNTGVMGAVKNGLLPGGSGLVKTILIAFYTSAIMNLTFGPAFMAAHRIFNTKIEKSAAGIKTTMPQVIDSIDWSGFIEFIVCKTIPFFWIPAHTIAFLLPGEYRILFAAFLSIALGAILAYPHAGKKLKADVT